MVGWIVLGVIILLVLMFVAIYNGLIAKRVRVETAWSGIDVQLKRRHDLIPNLVETVKGYAKHESGTLEAVVNARSRAVAANGVEETAAAESLLTGALGKLFALSEAYPDLKANTNFLQLQGELGTTENAISSARQSYNGSVRDYNTSIATIPANIVAGMFGFTAKPFFEIADEAERAVPKVSF
ncbi:MAG: LemA family protein [Planctomycetes bacterium]|nr:LemA family protein [Planctomycetota bacterium]